MRVLMFCFLCLPIGMFAQQTKTNQVQNSSVNEFVECDTPVPDYFEALRRKQKLEPAIEAQRNGRSAAAKIVVRLVLHRLSSSTGIEGPTDATMIAAVEKVRSEYSAGDICFSLDYINYINLDTIMTITGNKYTFMMDYLYPNYGDPDRLDFFIYPDELNAGAFAGAIVSDVFGMGEDRLVPTSVTVAHEIGHCLGLVHTHEDYGQSCPSALIENIDGSNCATAGDMICDTPADPNIGPPSRRDTVTCEFIGTTLMDCNGDAPYTPIMNNIMSYAGPCRTAFIPAQFDAMRAELLTGTVGPLVSDIAPQTLILTTGTVSGGENHRTALGTIISNFGDVITISNNAKVYHTAGENIILQEGYEIKPTNGRYTGVVGDPCN